MFLRVKSFKNKDGSKRDYLLLVANKKIAGKVKQLTLANFGRLEQGNEFIPQVAEKLSEYTDKLKVVDLSKNLKSAWSKEYGPVLIFKKIWEDLGLPGFLERYLKKKKIKFKVVNLIFSLVLNRLLEPKGELAVHQWIKNIYGLKEVKDTHQWYRSSDACNYR